MTETARMLDETVDRLLRRLLPDGAGQRSTSALRDAVGTAAGEAGLLAALAPEERGGLDLSLHDAAAIAWRWGYHAAPFPIVEAMLAAQLASVAGEDALAHATVADVVVVPHGVTPEATSATLHAPATRDNCAVLALARGGHASDEVLLVFDPAAARLARGLSGEAWLSLPPAAQPAIRIGLPDGTIAAVLRRGSLLTASAMVGATARVVEITIEHANTRVQFGRALGKFQAVQTMIADAASEQVVCQAALAAALDADATGARADLLAHVAKAQAARAATVVSAAAHQTLGAIGFTEEHVLGHYSRRLWDWRDRWGRESRCEEAIGRAACADLRGLWRHLVDPPPTEDMRS